MDSSFEFLILLNLIKGTQTQKGIYARKKYANNLTCPLKKSLPCFFPYAWHSTAHGTTRGRGHGHK